MQCSPQLGQCRSPQRGPGKPSRESRRGSPAASFGCGAAQLGPRVGRPPALVAGCRSAGGLLLVPVRLFDLGRLLLGEPILHARGMHEALHDIADDAVEVRVRPVHVEVERDHVRQSVKQRRLQLVEAHPALGEHVPQLGVDVLRVLLQMRAQTPHELAALAIVVQVALVTTQPHADERHLRLRRLHHLQQHPRAREHARREQQHQAGAAPDRQVQVVREHL
mmetsp:Transcript_37624/g.110196  ORF Transcript_37624/g.110196 Transcript_37624/m.110196 type:complete len:222 (-) Transcript_37624:367-1032(-)